jgi:hypothetical protein
MEMMDTEPRLNRFRRPWLTEQREYKCRLEFQEKHAERNKGTLKVMFNSVNGLSLNLNFIFIVNTFYFVLSCFVDKERNIILDRERKIDERCK